MSFTYTITQPDVMPCRNWLGKCYKTKAADAGIFVVYSVYPTGKPNPTIRWYCSLKCLVEDITNLSKTVKI